MRDLTRLRATAPVGPLPRFATARLGPVLVAGACLVAHAGLAGAQTPTARTGLEVGGVPALNFDADEGVGYGAVVALYHYGDGTLAPYRWSLQPTVFLTTKGRRDFTVFFDSPDLARGWRLDAFIGSEEQIATPYYGSGNWAPYDPQLVTDDDPRYYRFGRTRRSILINLQRPLGSSPLRVLLGAGAVRGSIVAVPDGEGTTLLAEELATGARSAVEGAANHVRAGLVWDTRDRETGTRRGTWSDVLVQRVDEGLGSETSYTRWTVTDRRYLPVGPVVVAHRILVQGVGAGVPLFDLHRIQTSFRDQEGLGGAKSVRGVLRNRFAGRGMMLWNAEVRWRAAEFQAVGRPFHAVLSGFADAGRVWEGQPRFGELLTDLHRGWGGGVRLGMGENFVLAADAGTGSETGFQLYIGLGYLY